MFSKQHHLFKQLTKVSNTSCSSNPVHIFLNASRHVKIYYMLHIADVKSTSCNLYEQQTITWLFIHFGTRSSFLCTTVQEVKGTMHCYQVNTMAILDRYAMLQRWILEVGNYSQDLVSHGIALKLHRLWMTKGHFVSILSFGYTFHTEWEVGPDIDCKKFHYSGYVTFRLLHLLGLEKPLYEEMNCCILPTCWKQKVCNLQQWPLRLAVYQTGTS